MSPTSAIETAADVQGNPAREILSVLWRARLTIGLVFTLVTGAIALVVLTTPVQYEAESSLMVRIGREYVYRSETGRNETVRVPDLSEIVNSEVEILSSRDLAEQVVRQLGVQTLYPDILEAEPDVGKATEIAVLRFRQSASIHPVLESSVIKVGLEHPVPQVAADAVNLLVEHFKDKHVEVFGAEPSIVLETQLRERSGELAVAEQALADFKHENGVYDLNEQRTLLLGRRMRLEEEQQTCELELSKLSLSLAQYEEPPAIPELPPDLSPEMKDELLRQRSELERELRALEPTLPDRLVEEASVRLLDLQLEESQLLRDYAESSRRVQTVRAEIEQVRTFLAGAEQRAGSYDEVRRRERASHATELSAEIAHLTEELELLLRAEQQRQRLEEREQLRALEVQRDDCKSRLQALEVEVRTLDQHEKTMRQLEREVTAAEATVRSFEQRVDEARMSAELDREKSINVRVIERAAAPIAPIGLSRNLQLALGAFVGLLAGGGFAVLYDLFRAR